MKNILVLGAGLSATSLIRYILENSGDYAWKLTLCDINEELAREKVNGHPNGTTIQLDIFNEEQRNNLISKADIVISMLPYRMHPVVAATCLKNRRHMVTASYISDEIRELDQAAKEAGILIMNEMGVDPGIDHMSAMRIINRIRSQGGRIEIFESNTGGLVAPTYDNNPWNYKFTWNPRNVVLAGQGGARFLHNSRFKYIPYHKIFERYEIIKVLDLGEFEVYPNRDSLKYQESYGLQDVSTMFRGTIRRRGFCDAWNSLVQIGATDDSYLVEFPGMMSYRDFTNSFLAYNVVDSVEKKLANYLDIEENGVIMKKLEWLGLFDRSRYGRQDQTPARVLQDNLEEKWKLDLGDKDMIVMQHQFEYLLDSKRKRLVSSMVCKGDMETAMSRTVGLPVGILTKLILEGKISLTGIHLPLLPEIYTPVLDELDSLGIIFVEEETAPNYISKNLRS
jgi:saccharopine dehydrogenase-like NADP-dependent oxidoreductase